MKPLAPVTRMSPDPARIAVVLRLSRRYRSPSGAATRKLVISGQIRHLRPKERTTLPSAMAG
jgi:hypothetical protein